MGIKEFLLVGCVLSLVGCAYPNQFTGRYQNINASLADDEALGVEALNELRAKNAKIQVSGPGLQRVKNIGARIASVSFQTDLNWEFIVIDEPFLNAWTLPGGKVAVYTRMLEILNDEELAVVVGHEMAHAALRHGSERLKPWEIRRLALVMEHEADHVGALFMAQAGYDPRTIPKVWRKIACLKEDINQKEGFKYAHPSDAERIERIEEKMENYVAIYLKR